MKSPWRLWNSDVDFLRRLGLVESCDLFGSSFLILVPEVEGSSFGLDLWRFMIGSYCRYFYVRKGKRDSWLFVLFCFYRRNCKLGFSRNLVMISLFSFSSHLARSLVVIFYSRVPSSFQSRHFLWPNRGQFHHPLQSHSRSTGVPKQWISETLSTLRTRPTAASGEPTVNKSS